MPRLCTVCTRPDRDQIDEALLVHDRSYRVIARQFGVHHDALQRHEHAHLQWSSKRSREIAAMIGVQTWMAPRLMAQGSRKKSRP